MAITDQDDWDELPGELKEHYAKGVAHLAGVGPHPGKYQGPEPEYSDHPLRHDEPTETQLAAAHIQAQGVPMPPAPKGPLPPSETLTQPPMQKGGGGKGGGGGGGKGGGQTPAAIAQQAVAPEQPAGEF